MMIRRAPGRVIVGRLAIKYRGGGRMDIDGLKHWVTIGLYVRVSGPVHEQRRLLWDKPYCGRWELRHRENTVTKKCCSCMTELEVIRSRVIIRIGVEWQGLSRGETHDPVDGDFIN